MKPMEQNSTGTDTLPALADALASLERTSAPAEQQRQDVALNIRAALERLQPNERVVLDVLLEQRGVTKNAVERVLSMPAPNMLRSPELPFARAEQFQVLAASMTPRDGFTPERPVYPQGVAPHLDSHHAQLSQLLERGEIPAAYAATLRLFIELHDRGYAGEAQPLNAEDFSASVDEYTAAYIALGANDEQAQRMATYVLDGLRVNDNPVKQHLLGRVIGHGVNSARFGRKTLAVEGGMTQEQADALAALFATHHLGYPLTPLVDGFAGFMGAPIPADLRAPFYVGGEDVPTRGLTGESLPPTERERRTQERADALRAAIADRVAPALGIDARDARAIAAIAYALDRMTPARRMRTFALRDDGSVSWTGGETEKRYPLIIGNIDAALKNSNLPDAEKPQKNLRSAYELSIVQFQKERDAALRTAENLGVEGLDEVIRRSSAKEIAATADVQNRAIVIADRLGAGAFATITADIARVTEEYRRAVAEPREGDDLDALGYLLGTLRVIEQRVKQVFPNG